MVDAQTAQEAATAALRLTENESDLAFRGLVMKAARMLEAALPDVGDLWAVVELDEGDGTAAPRLLAVENGNLYRCAVEAADGQVGVDVSRRKQGQWMLSKVSSLRYEDSAGAPHLTREWLIAYSPMLGVGQSFRTDHILVNEPAPDRAERLGRALAAVDGWPVGEVPTDI